jgi:hypothetical protein
VSIQARLRYFLAGLVVGVLLLSVGLGRARGEFRREVPQWWLRSALCVHRFEGTWRDPNGPYYGGLQMDLSFQRTYGNWMLRHHGTADHWSPRAQLIVAWRGYRQRGWTPWPNTAARCGLLRNERGN